MVLARQRRLARRRAKAYLKAGTGAFAPIVAPIVVMPQPLHPVHPVSDNSPTAGRTPSVLLLAGAGAGSLVVLGALALWFHYGSQVFFEMIRTGFAACF